MSRANSQFRATWLMLASCARAISARHVSSAFVPMLSDGCLMQQILQSASMVQAALNLRHKIFRHVDGNTTPARATVQNITLMLLARLACWAILTNTPATTQA